MFQVKDNTKKMQQKSRRPYKEPHLLIYGAMKDLTASGSSGGQESKAGSGTAYMI